MFDFDNLPRGVVPAGTTSSTMRVDDEILVEPVTTLSPAEKARKNRAAGAARARAAKAARRAVADTLGITVPTEAKKSTAKTKPETKPLPEYPFGDQLFQRALDKGFRDDVRAIFDEIDNLQVRCRELQHRFNVY